MGKGTPKAKRVTVARRRTLAVQMKLAGATWQQIADRLGYASRGAAHTDVGRALAAQLEEQNEVVEELRHLEVMRLNRLQVAAWTDAINGDLRAIDTCLRIIAHRCRLLGLFAPMKHEAIPLSRLDEEIGRLERELGTDS
jgi:hypothetical protein